MPIEVVSPAGQPTVASRGAVARLPDLNGKRVAEIWNGVFKGDQTFPIVREALRARYPGIEIVPYTEFPHVSGDDRPNAQAAVGRELAALARDKRCDAVISGNGA